MYTIQKYLIPGRGARSLGVILVALFFGALASLAPASTTHATTTIGTFSMPPNNLGLVGYWPFDGKYLTFATATDVSGQGNNGTLTNGPTPTMGKIGQALNFNGTNSYVSVPNASSLNPTNVTVAAWVKTNTAGGYIIAKDPPASAPATADKPNDLSAGQVSSSVTASAEKQPVNSFGQPSTIKSIAVSIAAYKNTFILLTLFLLSLFALIFYKIRREKFRQRRISNLPHEIVVYHTAFADFIEERFHRVNQKKISANSIISTMVIFTLLISPLLFPSNTVASSGGGGGTMVLCAVNRFWVGGTGTWDASDTTHWATISGGAGGASVPGATTQAIFDASSGGGTVTLGYSPSVCGIGMGAFTGTFDASTFSPTMSLGFSGTGTGVRTLNMGSGTWTSTGGGGTLDGPWDINIATNLTLNAQTSTIKMTENSSASRIFKGGSQVYNNVWFARGTATGTNVVSGSNTFNDFKDTGTAAHTIQFTAGTTQTVSTFTVSGTPGNVITINSDTTETHNLVKTGGGTISSDYLSIQHSVATPVSTWYAGTHSTDNQGVATAGSGWTFTDVPTANMPYSLSTVGGGQFTIISDGTTYTATSSVSVTDNQWHYVAGTYDGTTMKIFVDGAQTGSNSSFSGNLPTSKTGDFRVGADYNTTPANFFTGAIDETRIYNRALSASEIMQSYQQGSGSHIATSPVIDPTATSGLSAGLVGYWPFDGKYLTSATATDISGSGNNGTLVNSPTPTMGKVGQALKFNGTANITTTNTSDTNFTGAITLSVWAKETGVGNNQSFISKVVTNGATNNPFDFRTDATTAKLSLVRANGSGYREWLGPLTILNSWHHYVVVSNTAEINAAPMFYIDGVPSTGLFGGGSGTGNATGSGVVVKIGRRNDGGVQMVGSLDDVRIYNRALSATEVAQLYTQGGGATIHANVLTTPTPPTFACGNTITFTYNGSPVTYGTVTGADGKCWMDRNLGATQVATSATDTASYGHLFQWGRDDDGHQVTTSGTTATNADIPGNNLFITEGSTPYDWRVTPSDTLWANSSSTNNPCPTSWHVPLQTEWATVAGFFSPQTSVGAFNSALKLPLAGYRYSSTAVVYSLGGAGFYWSSSPNGTVAYSLTFTSGGVNPAGNYFRAYGLSVRCVKD